MCRNIKVLRTGPVAAPPDEIREAALQYIRKISGFGRPAAHNAAVFDQAVEEVAAVSARLLESLVIRGAR